MINHKGQTVIELAIFGSILIFVIGLIVNQTLNYNYVQYQQLKALRFALLMSYLHTEGLAEPNPVNENGKQYGTANRNQAGVIIVEDRLTVESAKYGARERNPLILSASATHSKNLFLPNRDAGVYQLPILDVFVNGVYFPFTMAANKRVCFNPGGTSCDSDCGYCNTTSYSTLYTQNCYQNKTQDCTPLYKRVVNETFKEEFCYTACHNNLNEDDRFDLDRNTQDRKDAQINPYPNACGVVAALEPVGINRNTFAWQWYRIVAHDDSDWERDIANITLIAKGVLQPGDEGIVKSEGEEDKNIQVDVDQDLKEEIVIRIEDIDSNTGRINKLIVLDRNDGDLDFSQDTCDYYTMRRDNPEAEMPGFTQGSTMVAHVKGQDEAQDTNTSGTYFQLEEGKLFGGGTQYIRSTSKKDQVDYISRAIKLSNDTGRFCNWIDSDPEDRPNHPINDYDTINGKDDSAYPNNVQACADPDTDEGGCWSTRYNNLNCLERNHGEYTLYIRSRLADLHGRKWVMPVGNAVKSEPNVEFDVPNLNAVK